MNAIRIGKGYLPQEVRAAVNRINNALSAYEGEFQIDPFEDFMERVYISRPFKWDKEKEYLIAENYEGGASSCVYRKKTWFYRTPWDGKDTPIPGGLEEVIAGWICYFTG